MVMKTTPLINGSKKQGYTEGNVCLKKLEKRHFILIMTLFNTGGRRVTKCNIIKKTSKLSNFHHVNIASVIVAVTIIIIIIMGSSSPG